MNDVVAHLVLSTLACSAALMLVLSVRTPLARRCGAGAAYAVWALVPLASLATWLPTRSIVRVVSMPSLERATAVAIGNVVPASMPRLDSGIDVVDLMCGLWMAGVVLSLAVFLIRHRRFVRSLGTLESLGDDVYRSRTTEGCPVLVGVWRSKIVVPNDFETRYDASERELILAHERHHRARGDAQANAFSTVVRSVFWFNPLVHAAAPFFLADQELACDAAVIARFANARRAYATALLKAQASDVSVAWACAWAPRNLLRERIARLASPSSGRSRTWLGNAAVAAIVVSGSVAAWASQPVDVQTRFVVAQQAATTTVRAAASTVSDATLDTSADSTQTVTTEESHRASEATVARVVGSTTKRADVARVRGRPTQLAATQRPRDSSATPTAATIEGRTSPVADDTSKVGTPTSTSTTTIAVESSPREIASYRAEHAPAYPAAAARAHIEGHVTLDVGVDEIGRPTDARVAELTPSTATELASASLAAVMQWRFEPASRAGHAVAGRVAVPFAYALGGDGAYASAEPRRQATYRTLDSGGTATKGAGSEGVVYVRVRIEDDGVVSSSAIDRIDPPTATDLGAPALASLGRWTFNPARERGKAVASTVVVPIVFAADAHSDRAIARIRNGLDPVHVASTRD